MGGVFFKMTFMAFALAGCASNDQLSSVQTDLAATKIRLLKVEQQQQVAGASESAALKANAKAEQRDAAGEANLAAKVRKLRADEVALEQRIGAPLPPAAEPENASLDEQITAISQRLAAIEQAQTETSRRGGNPNEKAKGQLETRPGGDTVVNISGLRAAFSARHFETVVAAAPRLLTTPNSGPQDEKRYLYGESLFRLGRKTDAYHAFAQLRRRSPTSTFAGKALLRIGEIQAARGQKTAAKATFVAVNKSYAGTPEAVTANNKLQALAGRRLQAH